MLTLAQSITAEDDVIVIAGSGDDIHTAVNGLKGRELRLAGTFAGPDPDERNEVIRVGGWVPWLPNESHPANWGRWRVYRGRISRSPAPDDAGMRSVAHDAGQELQQYVRPRRDGC